MTNDARNKCWGWQTVRCLSIHPLELIRHDERFGVYEVQWVAVFLCEYSHLEVSYGVCDTKATSKFSYLLVSVNYHTYLYIMRNPYRLQLVSALLSLRNLDNIAHVAIFSAMLYLCTFLTLVRCYVNTWLTSFAIKRFLSDVLCTVTFPFSTGWLLQPSISGQGRHLLLLLCYIVLFIGCFGNSWFSLFLSLKTILVCCFCPYL